MKIKNLEIDKDTIKRIAAIAAAALISVGGIHIVASKLKGNNSNKPIKIEKNDYITNEDSTYMEKDGIEYYAPDGYTLEIKNGGVYAVLRIKYTISPTKTVDANGNVSYSLPAGYSLDGKKGYKIVEIYSEPIIVVNGKRLNKSN